MYISRVFFFFNQMPLIWSAAFSGLSRAGVFPKWVAYFSCSSWKNLAELMRMEQTFPAVFSQHSLSGLQHEVLQKNWSPGYEEDEHRSQNNESWRLKSLEMLSLPGFIILSWKKCCWQRAACCWVLQKRGGEKEGKPETSAEEHSYSVWVTPSVNRVCVFRRNMREMCGESFVGILESKSFIQHKFLFFLNFSSSCTLKFFFSFFQL